MITLKSHASALKKLREQVSALKRKEKAIQKKLQLALVKVKKITTTYEKRLVKKALDTQEKLAKSVKQHVLGSKKAVIQKAPAKKMRVKK